MILASADFYHAFEDRFRGPRAEIKERLIKGSDPVPALVDVSVSDGRVNAAKSLEKDLVAAS